MTILLGNGKELPPIGFGTSTTIQRANELAKAIDIALETGYRHFDTAFLYQNEEVIGNVLQKWFTSKKLKREDVFVTSKLPFGSLHVDHVEHFIKESLSNLQIDYLDLYLIHFPVGYKFQEGENYLKPARDINGHIILEGKADHLAVWRKMEQLVDAGLVRYIGLSNFNIPQIQNLLKSARIKPSCLQIEVHLYLQQHRLIEFCQKHDIVVVGHSPLGSGDLNPRMKLFMPFYKEKELPNILGDKSVNHIALKYKKTPAQILLRFLVQSGVVPIPKSLNEHRIKENFDIFDFELGEYELKVLTSLNVGEGARIQDFKTALEGIENHPDYPFKKMS